MTRVLLLGAAAAAAVVGAREVARRSHTQVHRIDPAAAPRHPAPGAVTGQGGPPQGRPAATDPASGQPVAGP